MHKISANLNSKDLTLVIIPPNERKPINIRMPLWIVYLLSIGLIVFVLTCSFAIFYAINTNVNVAEHEKLKKVVTDQTQEIEQYSESLEDMSTTIKSLLEKDEEIRQELGEPKRKKRRSKRYNKANIFERKYKKLQTKSGIKEKIALLKTNVNALNKSYSRSYQKVSHNKHKFSYTPSIWPVYGRIRSGYGIRKHPILSRRVFHKGIDIPSWFGAPIKTTADGIVNYSGWSGGFGLIVIINHGFGYRTLYAHTSQTLVRKGQYVKKGEVIAQVGSSGLSTGAHVHYEVHRWRRPINPKPYLDLDMFTASTRIW
jgi:murein DD-endopeptidase MepM/ murein hydrolase activator NlpD